MASSKTGGGGFTIGIGGLAVFDLLDLVNVILPRFLSLAGDFQGQCVRLCPH